MLLYLSHYERSKNPVNSERWLYVSKALCQPFLLAFGLSLMHLELN